jgi:hypothetical protein
MDDLEVLAAIDEAFKPVLKPVHFTNFRHCEECAEHDALLRLRTRETLAIGDVGNIGWEPLAFSTPEGIAYYMPSLARLSLSEPTYRYGWYGDVLIFHLTYDGVDNALLNYCNEPQRRATALFLQHLLETRLDHDSVLSTKEEFAAAHALWFGSYSHGSCPR